jgi:sulfoxide reductase catalytic subunit YedY
LCDHQDFSTSLGDSVLIKKPNDIPSNEITPKSTYLSRRKFMTGAVAAGAALAGGFYLRNSHMDEPVDADGPKLTGIVKSQFSTTEKPTSFKDITNYNNYYEFSTDKYEPNALSKKFHTRPWTVKIDGLVKKSKTLDIDNIMKLAPLEERIYRHRCVEGWSMIIPWVGFPLSELIKQAEPWVKPSLSLLRPSLRPTRCPIRTAASCNGRMWRACAWMRLCIP